MTDSPSPPIKYDLYSERFRAQPYETFRRMRRDDPVLLQPGIDGQTLIWFVTRYEDVQAVLRDDRRFVRDPRLAFTAEELRRALPPEPPVLARINNHMLNKDGQDHRRLRGLVNKAFTPRIVNQMRPRIQAIANELLDRVETDGQMELMEAFAFPLPINVIAELLGIPVADQDKFRRWSDAVVTPDLSPGAAERFMADMTAFTSYLERLFDERRAAPRPDLVSGLIAAEEGGDRLSEDELFSMVVLLIIAGHETTVGLIGNAVLALLRRPEAMAELRAHPERIPSAVEELLRYDGPVERALNRWAAEDVSLGGKQVRRGDMVILVLGAADHDPEQFPDPETLDLARQPNRHLAFGQGAHYCLGAPLARLEAEIALQTLIHRLPGLKLDTEIGALRYQPTPMFRRLVTLPVRWN